MKEFEIRLEDVKFYAYHGVYELERQQGNDFLVNLTVKYEAPEENLISEDSIFNTVSYVSLFEIVKEEMGVTRNLIETVASAIVNRIKESFPVCNYIECKIAKMRPPIPDFNGRASVVCRIPKD